MRWIVFALPFFIFSCSRPAREKADSGIMAFDSIAPMPVEENDTVLILMAPLIDKFENNQPVTAADVLPFAEGLVTREMTFALLTEVDRLDLFPRNLLTIEKGAEAHLASWLAYPTELDQYPDEIQHVKKVVLPNSAENFYYHVFKFRVNEPHWAADDGWMLGCVGPYAADSKPYDVPPGTFSRFSDADSVSAEADAQWVHENVALRNPDMQ
jgi:hypothetical protein